MNKALIALSLILLLTLTGCSITKAPAGPELNTNKASAEIILRSYLMDRNFYERAFAKTSGQKENDVMAGIVSHHLFASSLIGDFFAGINNQPEIVVLIGPNHYNRGPASILTADAVWDTPYGLLNPASEQISALNKQGYFQLDDATMSAEHSISGLTPFIKKVFPDAKILPIIIKNSASQDSLDKLIAGLKNILPEKSLALASVDFSHEVISSVAEEQNEKSFKAISDYNYAGLKSINSDSWQSLYMVMKISEQKKSTNIKLLYNTDSGKMSEQNETPVTSYLMLYFR